MEHNFKITKELVEKAYRKGLFKLICHPENPEATVCSIGDEWFWFSTDADYYAPEKYKALIFEADTVQDIFTAIKDLENCAAGRSNLCAYIRGYLKEYMPEAVEDACKKQAALQSITTDDLVEELYRRNALLNDVQMRVLLSRSYIAWKVWSEEDIASRLVEKGYEPSESNITAVLNSGHCKNLSECTDSDWEIIDYAIYAVKGNLTEQQIKWIVHAHSPQDNKFNLKCVTGTKRQMKELLLNYVSADRDKAECYDNHWTHGTNSADDVDEYSDGSMAAYGYYDDDSSCYYTATPEEAIEHFELAD